MHPDDRAPLRAVLARLVGDEVIVEFARRLGACLRAEDPVARLGGDEFVVLVEDLEGAVTAEAIAAKLLVAMHDDVATSDGPIRMTTSVGVAVSHGGIDPIALVALADQTLYAATSAGRNTYRAQRGGIGWRRRTAGCAERGELQHRGARASRPA
ncbi:MAG TPA: GGDEF domain-containing protein [Tahibacter sp.]|uniref:GGDEF domain-containing protein n=1 Tax=Tahibacter sp. TaxID=2056211 RepID=UPI002CCDB822|nr:GGDEF domain-containing protein [Tahibacter sp.]HSX59458.1 GGDEF domain-containing protein [Tahibacter sp.]